MDDCAGRDAARRSQARHAGGRCPPRYPAPFNIENVSNQSPRQLPREIYRRRRVAALIGLLVVVALLIWGLTAAFGDKNNDAAPAETSSASPATPAAETTTQAADSSAESSVESPADSSAEPSGEASESKEPEAKESESKPAKPSPYKEAAKNSDAKGAKSCKLEDLKLIASSDESTYKEGQQPTFYMTVENPTGADCKIDLDEHTLRFEVYDLATNKRIWSDTDCYPSVLTGDETFKAGEKRHFEAVWSRMGSAPEQCRDRKPTPPGGYYLHTVIGNNPSPALTFNLR